MEDVRKKLTKRNIILQRIHRHLLSMEKSTHQEDKNFGVFRKREKSVVAQGACPRQGVRDEDLSIAGMAEEITHVVEELFSLMEWISGVGGVYYFSHWQWVEYIFGCV